ncbi:hypothetical protein D3C78_1504460 [compost metagenome]
MVNKEVARWFELCCAWIKTVFGEFTHDMENSWNHDVEQYNLEIPLGVLWTNTECRSLILEMIPMLEDSPQLQDAMGTSLRSIIEFSGGLLSNAQVHALDRRLQAIPVL